MAFVICATLLFNLSLKKTKKIYLDLLTERNIDTEDIDSIILIEPNVAYYTKSTAALEIGKNLNGLRTLSSILLWLPETFRNIVYDFVAKNRYKWYGKKDSCMIPTEELKNKFI